MKITTRLILSFLVVSILPLLIVGYVGLRAMDRASSLALNESTEALKRLGEAAIHQKALDVARQVELYLEAHPDLLALPPQELEADEALAAIAVQKVGETGYTAVYDSRGVTHFHVDPKIVGMDMHELANTLPAFWAIFEASLDGTIAGDYYEWQDADGTMRDKYMSCVPVGNTSLRVLSLIATQAAVAIENARLVREREERLKRQIEELRIEIDEATKARQVAEITETDYFQRLREAVRSRRERARRG